MKKLSKILIALAMIFSFIQVNPVSAEDINEEASEEVVEVVSEEETTDETDVSDDVIGDDEETVVIAQEDETVVEETVDYDFTLSQVESITETTVYGYDASDNMDEYTENPLYNPVFFVYPDTQVDENEAAALITELDMIDTIDETSGIVYVINPINETYSEADKDLYLTLLDTLSPTAMNLKIIGVENGATFVNEYVSQYNWAIAGIMTYGGETGLEPKYSVPAYISGSDASDYIVVNNATSVSSENGLTIYTNPDNEYEVVVESDNETLSEAFANAWENVFSKNGRIGNIGGTFFSMATSTERDFDYTSYITATSLNITRNVVKEDLDNDGSNSLWYEYLPESTLNAADGTVPVVVMLHGNGNDPRTQFTTSGWAEVANENGIILIEPEWQGSTISGYAYDAMTDDNSSTSVNDIITMINIVLEKYPQIDASRIYVEGLSRGATNSINIGLTQSATFAAIGSHSCGTSLEYYDALTSVVNETKDLIDMPMYFIAGTKDLFLPLKEMGEDGGVLIALQLYQTLNNMEVTNFADLSDENSLYFGMVLENLGYIENDGSLDIYGGTLSVDGTTMISLNAIEEWGHWNYEADAKLMWEFFSHYSRVDGEVYVDGSPLRATTDNTDPTVTPTPDTTTTTDTTGTTGTTTGTSTSTVKTGDETNIVIPVMAMISAAGVYFYIRRKRYIK